jgi:uncharacterized protein YdeI (BOF family)
MLCYNVIIKLDLKFIKPKMLLKLKYFVLSLVVLGFSFFISRSVIAEESLPKILISEIKIEGESSVYDEFIELYNPNDYAVDLDGWSIKRVTGSGSDGGYISSDVGLKKYPEEIEEVKLQIPAFGYLLIVPRNNCGESKNEKCYLGDAAPGNYYSTNSYLAENNSIILYDNKKSVIDSFGWGSVAGFAQISSNPEKSKSIERKIVDGKIEIVVLDVPAPQNNVLVVKEDSVANSGGGDSVSDSENNNSSQGSVEESNIHNPENISSDDVSGSTPTTSNENPKIIISEFLINPEDSDRDSEFLEIYNQEDKTVDISDWTLEDQVGSVHQYKIPQGVSLEANQYKTFYSDETGITLNNAGDGVLLRNSSGVVVSKTPVTTDAKDEISYAVDENGKWSWTVRVTPKNKNIIEAPQDSKSVKKAETEDEDLPDLEKEIEEKVKNESFDFSDSVVISEILPDPDGKDNQGGAFEWLELFNESEEDVNLKGWILDDVENKGSKAYQIKEDLIIKAKKYLVISSKDSKLFFNNPGDEVNLFWPEGDLVDSVEYQKSKEGFSYSLLARGNWGWSDKPTPGEENVLAGEGTDLKKGSGILIKDNSADFSEEDIEDVEGGSVLGIQDLDISKYQYADIGEIKKMPLHSLVGLDGIVSTPPGIFGDNIFYIYNKKSGQGVQIFSYSASLPPLKVGDQVQLFGYVSKVGGEVRVVLQEDFQIEIMSEDNLLDFSYSLTGEINESQSGNLTQIKGEVIEVGGNDIFYVDDGSGRIKIYIKPSTGITLNVQKGDQVMIKGQISSTSLGVRILPRFDGDVDFMEKQFSDIIEGEEQDKGIFGVGGDNWMRAFLFLNFLVFLDWGRMRSKKQINKNSKVYGK